MCLIIWLLHCFPNSCIVYNKKFKLYGQLGLFCSILIQSSHYTISKGFTGYLGEYKNESEGSSYDEFNTLYMGSSLTLGIKKALYKNFLVKTEGQYIYGITNMINPSFNLFVDSFKSVNYSALVGTIGLEYEF